jgi:hypothetical protein
MFVARCGVVAPATRLLPESIALGSFRARAEFEQFGSVRRFHGKTVLFRRPMRSRWLLRYCRQRSQRPGSLVAGESRPRPEGAPDNATTYCETALVALERLLVSRGHATHEALANRRADWIRAYLATPHGLAVKLGDA